MSKIKKAATKKTVDWTLESIHALDWRRFEELCHRLFEANGFSCKTQDLGSDEGIDIHLYFGKDNRVLDRIVHCKTWQEKTGIGLMCEFLLTMESEKAKRGTFVSRGGFTDDAQAFAEQNGIHTINAEQLLALVIKLDTAAIPDASDNLNQRDDIAPVCPDCGIKLVPRSLYSDKPYWGCVNWKPHGRGCITRLYMTDEQLAVLKPEHDTAG